MSWLYDFLHPRQDVFLHLLIEQSDYAVKSLGALMTYADGGNDQSADAVRQYEKDADEVRRILIDDLNRTFVTPMDREDIFALSRAIDDIIDYAYSTVEEMSILCVKPNDQLRQMVSLLHDAAIEVNQAMKQLKQRPRLATDHAKRAKAIENQVESVYRATLADLFNGATTPDQVVEILKLREIYRHLSNAADRGDEAANIINDIVVKMT